MSQSPNSPPVASRKAGETIAAGLAVYDDGTEILLLDDAASTDVTLRRPFVALTSAVDGDVITITDDAEDVPVIAGDAIAVNDEICVEIATGKFVKVGTYPIPPGGWVAGLAQTAASGDAVKFRARIKPYKATETIPGGAVVVLADAAATMTRAEQSASTLQITPTAGRAITTRTALQIIADLLPYVGAKFVQHVINAAAETHAATWTGGTDVTVRGTAAIAATVAVQVTYIRNSATTVVAVIG